MYSQLGTLLGHILESLEGILHAKRALSLFYVCSFDGVSHDLCVFEICRREVCTFQFASLDHRLLGVIASASFAFVAVSNL